MSDEGSAPESDEHKVWMESDRRHGVDPHQQFRVVSYVAMAAAAPFIIVHLLIGTFAFPYLSQVFSTMPGPLPWPSAVVLGAGWLAGPLLAAIDIATFWIAYRIAERWWIGLLFLPVLIYGMMSAFLGFLLYIPMFPLITLVR
jgi:hypothetical protein